MKKTHLSLLIRVSVSLVLILILLYIMRDKYTNVLSVLKGARISLVSLGLLCFAGAIGVASVRLKLIIDAQDNVKATFLEAISLSYIGYFFNNFLPTSIGGDVVKAHYLSRKTPDRTTSYTAVFVDRAIGLLTMVFMAFVAILLVDNRIIDKGVKNMICVITAVSFMLIVFMMNKRIAKKFSGLLFLVKPIEGKLRKVYNAVNVYRHRYLLIFQSLMTSILSQLLFFVSIGILAKAIGSRIPMMEILLRMPIISMMSLLPSINGLGVREGSTVLLFGPLIGKESAFAVAILWFFVLLITSVAGGLVYAISPQFKITLKEAEEETNI